MKALIASYRLSMSRGWRLSEPQDYRSLFLLGLAIVRRRRGEFLQYFSEVLCATHRLAHRLPVTARALSNER
jgi:hypothetical protein